MISPQPVGTLLRDWRQRRHMSQLDLACEAEVSTRHLSFVETGRSQPSREMLLHLAELLDVPLRERNALLVAAGYAPLFPERPLNDPALSAARRAVDLVLSGHEPNPAIAVDRHWTLVAANRAAGRLLAGADPRQLQPPVNVLRLSLHPDGLAARIENYAEWRAHVLARLRRQVELTADPVLMELVKEIAGYPAPGGAATAHRPTDDRYGGVVVPMRLLSDAGVLALFGTVTVFGTPVDITLSELAVESFFPADAQTAEILRRLATASD
jgi:transcriptional regulator with XRE-family HTH domain